MLTLNFDLFSSFCLIVVMKGEAYHSSGMFNGLYRTDPRTYQITPLWWNLLPNSAWRWQKSSSLRISIGQYRRNQALNSMKVVCNTGPLLHLFEIKALDLLKPIGEIWIPPGVVYELSQLIPDLQLPAWVKIHELAAEKIDLARQMQQADLLHKGEAEALALAGQIQADWFLTDDAAARLLGVSLGFEVHDTIGIILWNAAAGHLEHSQTASHIERLRSSSLWMSVRVITAAREALDRLFPGSTSLKSQ